MSGSRGALVGPAVAGLALGLAALAIVLSSEHQVVGGPFIVLALTLGWAFIGTGLYALWRRRVRAATSTPKGIRSSRRPGAP